MYNSPIEMLITDIQHQIVKQQDEEIYEAVVSYIPNIDKDELLRALQYDRGQYDKGYADGKADAMAELVRCKDCKHKRHNKKYDVILCDHDIGVRGLLRPDDFCSYGERKDNV